MDDNSTTGGVPGGIFTYPSEPPAPLGWVCPKCGRGVAPRVDVCLCVSVAPHPLWPWQAHPGWRDRRKPGDLPYRVIACGENT